MSDTREAQARLAVNGGPKARTKPWPGRGLVGAEERKAVNELFDLAIETGNAPGYNGEVEEAYCAEFAQLMGGGYADAVNSGTASVYVALRALDIEPFTEIVVSPVTDPGGLMPIPLLNCIPVIADTVPRSYNTGPEQIEACLTERTSAIVIAHIGGVPADIAGIVEVASARNIPVVEDCAQAHLATLGGKLVGTFGKIAAFSTMFGKHHCTGGQGGVVFTSDQELGLTSRRVSDRGKPFGLEGHTNVVAALNLNLNDLAAAIGREQLKKLPGIVQKRKTVVERIGAGIAGLSTVTPGIIPSSAEPSYWFWAMEAKLEAMSCDKATYCAALSAEGLPINPSYGAALPHTFEWFTSRRVFGTSGYPWTSPDYHGDADRKFPCPNALDAVARLFNLSITESWGEAEIASCVAAFTKVDAAYKK